MILAGGSAVDGEYDRLSAVAPVVGYRGTQLNYGWRSHARDVGRVLGLPDRAEAVVAPVDTMVGDVRSAHPEFEGRTASYSFHFTPDAIQTINSPDDYAAQFLGELGLRLVPAVLELEGASGAQISLERLGVLDADVLVMAYVSTQLRSRTGGQRPVLRRARCDAGRVHPDRPDTVTAIRNPSVLSIPYGLDQLVPKLATALA